MDLAALRAATWGPTELQSFSAARRWEEEREVPLPAPRPEAAAVLLVARAHAWTGGGVEERDRDLAALKQRRGRSTPWAAEARWTDREVCGMGLGGPAQSLIYLLEFRKQ